MKIRKAKNSDVRAMHKLLQNFAESKELLPRSLDEIYDHLQQFYVAEDKNQVVGTCALAVQWDNLAEIKALAVAREYQGRGLGKKLVNACLKEARQLGLTRIFALTMKDGFFKRMGFQHVVKNNLPHKVWTECVHCPYFPDECVEIAMVKEMDSHAPPLPAFKPSDLPRDGTIPTEPILLPVKPAPKPQGRR